MKDRFSTLAQKYAAFRPTYPSALYEFVLSKVGSRDIAWDAGTGNGQVARHLSEHFKKVLATDISAAQLKQAYPSPRIEYSVAGEDTGLPARCCDLITVAQAIHWFDRDKFYREVRRVGKAGGVIAVWGYSLLHVDPVLDEPILHFYRNVVGPYWDDERKLVDEHYRTISFPFEEWEAPAMAFSFQWTRDEFQGYLGTWSAVYKYRQATGKDPLEEFMQEISPRWKSGTKTVSFPLFMRIGRI